MANYTVYYTVYFLLNYINGELSTYCLHNQEEVTKTQVDTIITALRAS